MHAIYGKDPAKYYKYNRDLMNALHQMLLLPMDTSPKAFIKFRVENIQKKMFSTNVDPYSYLGASAYDTAWLAMIPHPHKPSQPMFKSCMHWLLNNQKEPGFWGDCDAFGKPTIESLPATLASMIAVKKWSTDTLIVEKGLDFIQANAEQLLLEIQDHCPRWFAIVWPTMVEQGGIVGLEIVFPETVKEILSHISSSQKSILQEEELSGKHYHPPLLSYLEALPPSYAVSEEVISNNLSSDGSLFQSPSATAKAFMATGKQECLAYLQSLVERCPDGVPQTFPMDEDLIKLCMVNHLERLGLAEHFSEETEVIMSQVYRNYKEEESWIKPTNMIAAQLQKDSLAFSLLRMHGYQVSPMRLCWFLHQKEIREQVEQDFESLSSAMLNVYRASNLMFWGEYELDELRAFSRKLLEKTLPIIGHEDRLHKMIELELNLPWFARLDHLEHRTWIEENEANALWKGKTSYIRIASLQNEQLLQLARDNYEFRQSIYKNELEELKRWSEKWGLSRMGFGREKTSYCYFAVAAGTTLPPDSYIRMLVAKSAIIITVVDDFFDMEGSLSELEGLTGAVRRWDSRGLSGHSKVTFDALDNLVSEAAAKYLQQSGIGNITKSLQDIWYETFVSWLVEAKWSRIGHTPSIDDYLMTGMTSIATHTLVLPASCFVKPSIPSDKLRPVQYENITKQLMVITRLLNDIQSYQKEKEEGKMNSVLLNLAENPELDIEDSVALVRDIIDKMKKEMLEHVLIDGHSDLPKISRRLHLSCLKVFQMFFNTSNRYNSDTEMLQDINKAIYLPVSITSKPLNVVSLQSGPKKNHKTLTRHSNLGFKYCSRSFTAHRVIKQVLNKKIEMAPMAQKVVPGFF